MVLAMFFTFVTKLQKLVSGFDSRCINEEKKRISYQFNYLNNSLSNLVYICEKKRHVSYMSLLGISATQNRYHIIKCDLL